MLYEEKIIETIPVGPLGLIPLKSCTGLGKKVDDYLVEEREKANISQLSHFPDIREIPIFWKQTHQGLVPVKEKEQLKNLSEVMTSILW